MYGCLPIPGAPANGSNRATRCYSSPLLHPFTGILGYSYTLTFSQTRTAQTRPYLGAHNAQLAQKPPLTYAMASYTNGFQPNATAGPSDATRYANPQLGPEPWFTYPTPTPEELDNELPPYEYAFENEDVGLSDILHRLTVKGHEDLARLAGETYV